MRGVAPVLVTWSWPSGGAEERKSRHPQSGNESGEKAWKAWGGDREEKVGKGQGWHTGFS